MGTSASSFLGGNYIKAETLKASGPVRGVIADVKVETFSARDGKPAENRLAVVLDLGTEEKVLTLNKTNLRVLIAAYGDDTDAWRGKQVIAYFDPNVQFGGRLTGGVRVKVPSARRSSAAAAAPAPAPASSEPAENGDDDIPF